MKSNQAKTSVRRSRPSAIASKISDRNRSADHSEAAPETGGKPHNVSTVETRLERMIADAAHDLRSPLTGIRESIRMVVDDTRGPMPDDHSECLSIAIEQCDVMQQIIEGMLGQKNNVGGAPTAHRDWVKANSLCQHLQRVIQAAIPKDADIYWDYELVHDQEVYADTALIQRLISNLINNAIKASPSGSPILVRVVPDQESLMLRWSIMDQGPGLSTTELQQVVRRHVSHQGGHGLGLSICAAIAATHFSSLEMMSIRGTGTEVSFQLPAAGPASMAEAWCRWRLSHTDKNGHAKQTFGTRHLGGIGESHSGPLARIDNADSITGKRFSSPNRVTIEDDFLKPQSDDHVIAGTLQLGAAHPIASADLFDKSLQSQMSPFDLAFRIDSRKWVWVFDTPVQQIESRLRTIVQAAEKLVSSPRLNWSDPQMISLRDRCFKARVTDMLVRETLQARANEHAQDNNQVRMGTKPISISPIAMARLDKELSRLTSQFKTQSNRLREHAQKMQKPHHRPS